MYPYTKSIVNFMLLVVMYAIQDTLSINYCDNTWILVDNYTRESIVEMNNTIYDIAVSPDTGNMYIVSGFYLHVLKKGKNKTEIIIDADVYSVAVGVHKNKIYVGGRRGLRIYDEDRKNIEDIPSITYFIWQIFIDKYKWHLYAMRNESSLQSYNILESTDLNQTSVLILDHIKIAKDNANKFVIDAEGNFYYNRKVGAGYLTQVLLKGHDIPITYSKSIVNLAVDINGRVYGTSNRSLYLLRANDDIPELITKIMTLDFDPLFMNFDENNNIIFGTTNHTVVVVKYENECSSNSFAIQKMQALWGNLKDKLDLQIQRYNQMLVYDSDMEESIYNITIEYNNVLAKMHIS